MMKGTSQVEKQHIQKPCGWEMLSALTVVDRRRQNGLVSSPHGLEVFLGPLGGVARKR